VSRVCRAVKLILEFSVATALWAVDESIEVPFFCRVDEYFSRFRQEWKAIRSTDTHRLNADPVPFKVTRDESMSSPASDVTFQRFNGSRPRQSQTLNV
jgi:hypothetical protein